MFSDNGLSIAHGYKSPETFYLCSHAEKTIILLGAPGAEKGTQLTNLRDKLNWPLVSPSTIFREELFKTQ